MENKEMANALNYLFASVFTVEATANIPKITDGFISNNIEEFVKITITGNKVFKKLRELNANNSLGANDLHPMISKKVAAGIINPWFEIFQNSVLGGYQKIGNQPTLVQKREEEKGAGNYLLFNFYC